MSALSLSQESSVATEKAMEYKNVTEKQLMDLDTKAQEVSWLS